MRTDVKIGIAVVLVLVVGVVAYMVMNSGPQTEPDPVPGAGDTAAGDSSGTPDLGLFPTDNSGTGAGDGGISVDLGSITPIDSGPTDLGPIDVGPTDSGPTDAGPTDTIGLAPGVGDAVPAPADGTAGGSDLIGSPGVIIDDGPVDSGPTDVAGGGSDFVDGPTDLGPPRDIPYDDSPGVITDIGVGPADAGVGGGARTYVIKSGDQLWNVSEQHYQTGKHWQLIVAANPGLNPTSLPIGKTITIPPLPISTAGAGAVSGAGSADPLTSAGEKVYVVKSGDSGMWGVSESQYGHGKYFQAIAKRNPKVDSANLKVGQKLVIPSLEQAKILISGGTVTAGDTGGSGVTVVGAGGGAISGPTLGLGEKIYVVKDGDSGMWAISKSQYGDGKYFTAIASRNPKINPSKLKIGQKIVIPSLEQAQSHVSGGSSSGGGTSSPVPRPIPRPRPTPRPAPAPAPTGGSDEPDFS